MLAALSVGLLVSLCSQSALAAFGVTDNGDSYTIDAGSANPLIFTVDSSSCDITSILYRSQEYQYSATGSHIGSGLGSADVSVETLDDVIKVTCTTDTLIHYYVAKSGDSVIYMATYTSAEPSIGELRYIARLDSSVLPSEYPFGDVSTTAGSSETVEGSDVFVVDGETRSKFYSSERFIDDDVHCVYGDDVHACMLMPQYETSSGGPFFRDINTNNGGDMTALYWYMNSGHVQTESYRMGLHGPYAMYWSRSGIPTLANVDFSFMADLDLEGYVAESGRGTVTGTASGVDGSAHQIVLHWYNDDAQYWTYASSSGAFTSPAMKPGTYTMVLYQTELKVAEASVTVTAGSSASANIASEWDAHDDSTLFQIGVWDGKPDGFLNAENQLRMHPSDSRMSDWGPVTYTVGSSADSSVPMALFKGVNDPLTITLALDDADTSGEATLRVGTTLSFAGGRPSITVNDHSDSAAAPTKIDSRGVTRGAYRGYGEIYDFTIPDGTLSTSNTITISVISGSSGDGYLTPNYVSHHLSLETLEWKR